MMGWRRWGCGVGRVACGLVVLMAGALVRAETKEAPKRTAFVPGEVWPDTDGVHINAHGGGVLHHEGVYYWFGEHKIAGGAGNQAHVGVRCYSSRDLYNWKNEGVAFAVEEDPDSEVAAGCVLERPKVVYNAKTGRFVLWFHLEFAGTGYRTARTAVAVAERVTGPYRYVRSFRPHAGQWPIRGAPPQGPESEILHRDFAKGQMARDMTVFVDDDGTAYHVCASEENQTLHIAELTPDYLDFTGKYARVFPGGYNEAPAIFKHAGRYYLLSSGCTGWRPNAARSAVADSIWGPWRARGNPCVGPGPRADAGADKTFGGQSTCVFSVEGKAGAFIAMFDAWRPRNAIDGRYVWLPVAFTDDGGFEIRYRERWDLSVFDGR